MELSVGPLEFEVLVSMLAAQELGVISFWAGRPYYGGDSGVTARV